MSGLISAGLRGLALLWTLLITALIGNVIASNNNAKTSAQSAVNFAMFVAALSWVALLYGLVASFVSSLAMPIVMLPLDGLATLFTFIAAIVLAAKLGAPNCGNIDHDDHSRSWIAYGSGNDEKRCREIQASTAFMWFLWACFMGCLFFTVKNWRGGGGSIRSSRPAMSQV
ncbi:membrane-associating domain-containing protein [Sarocladium implicatum]|nr:membrane-associating domain-containing protein [Sarocladium implicatum]